MPPKREDGVPGRIVALDVDDVAHPLPTRTRTLRRRRPRRQPPQREGGEPTERNRRGWIPVPTTLRGCDLFVGEHFGPCSPVAVSRERNDDRYRPWNDGQSASPTNGQGGAVVLTNPGRLRRPRVRYGSGSRSESAAGPIPDSGLGKKAATTLNSDEASA